MIKNWEIFNEATSHWREDILKQLKFERIEDIKDLFYDFIDLGFGEPRIETQLRDKNWGNPGKIASYLTTKNPTLYKCYYVTSHCSKSDALGNIDLSIEIYDALITILNRLKEIGFGIIHSFQLGTGSNLIIHLIQFILYFSLSLLHHSSCLFPLMNNQARFKSNHFSIFCNIFLISLIF